MNSEQQVATVPNPSLTLAAKKLAGSAHCLNCSTEWLITIISIWIPLYLLISLRVVYRQNWLLTVGKFIVIGISYATLLGLVTVSVAITSFVML